MMTQNPYAQPDGPSTGDFGISSEPPRTSVLAIFALVLSLICCIPVLPLVGVALGVVATLLITGSGGRVGGRGLAIGAIVVGLAVSGLQLAVVWGVASGWNSLRGVGDSITYAEARDYDAFRSEFDQRVRPLITDEVIDAYATELDSRVGAYIGIPPGLTDILPAYGAIDETQAQALQAVNSGIAPAANTIPLPAEFDSGYVILLPVLPADAAATFPPPMANLGYVPPGESSPVWLIDLQASIDAINGNAPIAAPSGSSPAEDPATEEEGAEAPEEEPADEPTGNDADAPSEPDQGDGG